VANFLLFLRIYLLHRINTIDGGTKMKILINIFSIAICLSLFGCSRSQCPCPADEKPICLKASPLIGGKIPGYELDAFHKGEIKKIKLDSYKKKWLILFFYPADFTFVCPTELKEMQEYYEKFKKAGAEVISISTDSVYVHQAWAEHHEDIKKIAYPMASDRSGRLSRALGVFVEEKGIAIRASFVVDPDGKITAYEIHDESIGRSASELFRKLEAAIAIRASDGGLCPANWTTGKEMIKPK
jgi:peroxiredoxin